MALNDLIGNKFFRVAGALAALAAPYVVGCEGDSTTNKNYYGEGNGSGGSGEYSCESACQNMSDCCKSGEKKKQHCYDEEKGEWKGYVYDVPGCTVGCENYPSEWSQGMIKCNTLYCNPDEIQECDSYQ
ncbi:hypothetical protein HZC30_07925 [Candidatus Woesearchaeota archaeon]|nr:hypothetical protein [Candidatus Woesearchaeota archaeon]